MQGTDLLIFLVDNRGYSYYLDAHGSVQVSYGLVPLNYTPMDWQDMTIKYTRSDTYGFVQRSFTLPLKYVKDAAKIARYKMYREGCEAVLNQRIYQLNKAFGAGLQHELMYDGPLDFSKFDRQHDHVVCNILEAGLDSLLKANENTTYEIDVDADPDAIQIYEDGLEFVKTNNFAVADGQYSGSPLINHRVPVMFVSNEGISPYVTNSSQNMNDLSSCVHTNIGIVDVVIPWAGSVKFRPDNGITSYHFIIFVHLAGGGDVILFDTMIGTVSGTDYNIPFNLNVTLPPGAKLQIAAQMVPSVSPANFDKIKLTYYKTTMGDSFKSRYAPSVIKALKGETLFRRLLTKMFGYDPGYVSDLLTNQAKNIMYTSGDAVRGLAGSKIKMSFSRFWKNVNFLHCSCFGFIQANGAQVPILEKLTYAYQPTRIAHLGEALTTDQFAEDRVYNNIKLGYPNQDYGDVNGRHEFNVTQEYTTDITRVVKVYDITQDVRGDAIGRELVRINLDGKTTTDSNSDNDTFVIDCENAPVNDPAISPNPFYRLYRGPYDAISGVISPTTVSNVRLSPKTRLLEHGTVLRGALYYHPAGKIKYQTSEKNANLSYTIQGKTVTESADLPVNYWVAPTTMPHYFKITCKPPKNLQQLLASVPAGYFEWTDKGITFRGFLIEITYKPAQYDTQDWRLLAMGDNDMTKLI